MKFIPLFLAFVLFPGVAGAATLYLSPGSGSYTTGKPFTVNVLVASSDQALNAVSGTISVPSDLFTISSASSVGSIVNFWVQQPQVSGSTVSFEGVVLNPGYQGGGAKVASLVLVPKKTGTGSVSFSSAAVLANDGQGTNILNSASGAQYSVQEASTPPPVVTPTKEEPPPPPPEGGEVETPRVVDFDSEVEFEDLVALRGVTYENATVEVRVYKDGLLYTTELADSNSVGDFSVVIAKKLPPGAYEIALVVTTQDGEHSVESERLRLVVKGDMLAVLGQAVAGHLGMVSSIALALIALIAVLHAYGWHRLFKLSKEVQESHAVATDVTKKVFSILRKDIAGHVKKIQEAGETRILSKEEIAFLDDFAHELEEAEQALGKKKKK